ncbi:MAG: FtsW/RodA/SpoVE family cell cycle protein [Planctomycetes bacterium]|nr:FtsW/RodA/SpoVE family cell cycle protein [Planctomycetota bacterium]
MKEASERRRGAFAHIVSLRAVRWGSLDWHVLFLALVLLCLGLAFVHAMHTADILYDRPPKESVDFDNHVVKVLLSLPFLVLGLSLRARWIARQAWLVYAACLGLLVALPFVGHSLNGAKRWITVPGTGFDLQPSELAKIGVVLMLARILYKNKLAKPRDWGPPLAVALVPMALVARQPDLGTALSLVPVTLGMLYIAGARAGVLARFLVLALLLGAGLVKFHFVHEYQLRRVNTWVQSFAAEDLIDGKSGAAFHAYHARVAIGNGGLSGAGLGEGIANTAGHLPERDCDSIFAVVSEESGWLGTTLILGVYALLVAAILGSASRLRDRFSRLAVAGIGLYFSAHLFIHAAVNLGLVPLTGIPLPLFSTGGSSMMATMLALGLCLGLAANREPSLDRDSFRA